MRLESNFMLMGDDYLAILIMHIFEVFRVREVIERMLAVRRGKLVKNY